jgi:hypothetical protein
LQRRLGFFVAEACEVAKGSGCIARAFEVLLARTAGRELNVTAELKLPDPAAHMYPSDLSRFKGGETFAHSYSVAVGNPSERSVPLFTLSDLLGVQARLADALMVLGMVDKNNRIKAGERGKSWSGKFVEAEIRRVLDGMPVIS